MKISVFTPIHRDDAVAVERLLNAFRSLQAQLRKPDEWVVVLNGAAILAELPADMRRCAWVKEIRSESAGNIGALKRQACSNATGDILVELDYDDWLMPDALELIEQEFLNDPELAVVYSDALELRPNGDSNLYLQLYGWGRRVENIGGVNYLVNESFPPLPHYMRRIEWAPNHVRAFRAEKYREIEGHDFNIPVGDDHDLLCRFFIVYGEKAFKHIPKVLYVYNIHDDNTCNGRNRNAEIQRQVDLNYCRHAENMYGRWSIDNGLRMLDLGGRIGCPVGYESVDLLDADHIADLNKPWPFADNMAGVIRAYHVLEHLDDPIHFFNEAYRVLAPGGFLLIEVPSVDGAGAFADPTHKKYFNTLSFEYYTNKQYARYIQPAYTGRFQKSRVVQYWWDNPKIPVISAQLIALKGWYDEAWCGMKEM